MAVNITVKATAGSTYVITGAFTDEDGAAVAPKTLKWTLTDLDSNVINNREEVEITTPASTETVVLSGADLALQAAEIGQNHVHRWFCFEGTYDSDLGSDLPLVEEAQFEITAVVADT